MESVDRTQPFTLTLSRDGVVFRRVTVLADDALDAEYLAAGYYLCEQCGTNMSDEILELSVEEAA
jgi:hypothetical protein